VALICLATLAAAALAGMGWMAWLVTTKTERASTAFLEALTRMKTETDQTLMTLVLGYKDSAPPREPVSIEPSESETSPTDVNSWDDMPDHIKEHYLREQMEDSLMQTTFLTSS